MILIARSLTLRILGPAALALAGIAALSPPLAAAERLSDMQLDMVTAGGVEAIALAEAWASGPHASAVATTETLVRRDTLRSFEIRRMNNGLTLVESVGNREVEYGYAAASARAEGTYSAVSCHVDLQFSVPPATRLTSYQNLARPGRSACLCSTFGLSILPH